MVNSRAKRGNGFRGVLDYLCDHDDGHCIGGNMSSSTPRDLAREFGAGRRARPDVRKPVWHMSLRLPAGEKLSEQKWVEIADAFAEDMEFTPSHQRAYFIHNCEAGQHIHIVCNRVGLDGALWYGVDENLKATKICQNLEKKFGLTLTQKPEMDKKTNLPSSRSTKKRHTPRKPEIEKSLRLMIKPDRIAIAGVIDKVLQTDRPRTPETFKTALAAHGVETVFFTEDEKIKGVTFHLNGLKFSGSALGDNYKLPSLVQRMKEQQNDKTQNHSRVADAVRNGTGHPNDQNPERQNQGIGKKGLAPRTGRRATHHENLSFQSLSKEQKMNEQKSIGGLIYRQRTPAPHDPENLNHGWSEFTDKSGKTWFYPQDEQPAPGNLSGYSWHTATQTRPAAVEVYAHAIDKHGIEQAARDCVRIAVFKGLPEPITTHGTPEFRAAVAREMFKLNIELADLDGPAKQEFDRLHKTRHEEMEKSRLERVNFISASFQGIDDQAAATHRAALARAASEDTPSKKDSDDRMRLRGPRQ